MAKKPRPIVTLAIESLVVNPASFVSVPSCCSRRCTSQCSSKSVPRNKGIA
jgi:hypothetical protein